MRIEEDLKLGFKDVLIRPKRSTLKSRSDVELERQFTFKHSGQSWSGVPIIAANMDTVGTFSMASALASFDILTAVHKHYSVEEWQAFINNSSADVLKHVMVSTGTSDADFEKTKQILDLNSALNFVCIDVAIMAEGYTADESDLFYKDAAVACEALFAHEPFKKLKDRFNIVAVFSESKDSGVSIPRKDEWKKTAVSSHFDTFYSDRYLTTRSVKAIHNWLAGIPYEHIIILANTDTYGGGGIYNSYTLTTAHHSMFRPVVVHEFGHSFGGLADEYAYDEAPSPLYPYDIEPWEPNITTLVHFEDKWKDMLEQGTPVPTKPQADEKLIYTKVGVYEGAGYTKKGIYRPTTECRMRINEAPVFCPVCQRSLERTIRFYTE